MLLFFVSIAKLYKTRYMKSIHLYAILMFITLSIHCLSAQPTFSEVTVQAGLIHTYNGLGFMGSGSSFFDYNNDNYLDVYLTGGFPFDKLFRNNGDGTFTDVSATAGISHANGVQTIGVCTGDLDNDGYKDIFVTTRSDTPPILWKNNGDGTFTDITLQAGINTTSDGIDEDKQGFTASMGDFNLDGYLDIYLVNWIDTLKNVFDGSGNLVGFNHVGAPNRFYINNGDMTFTEVADVYNVKDFGCGLASVFSDYDNDADVDILVANDFGEWGIPDVLYQNQYPNLTFTDVSASSGFDSQLYGMGIGIGDYDQDGDLDYYKTNIGRNVLLHNNGNGTFTDTTAFAGVEDEFVDNIAPYLSIGWGAGFMDFDHDTYLDLVVANGRVGSPTFFPSLDSMPDKLFKNNGDGTFTDVTLQEGLVNYGLSRGFSYGDMDNDGDIDILFTCVPNQNLGIPANPVLFENNLNNGKNWLKVKLVGTLNNRDAYGSHIEIHVNGQSWLHEIGSGGQGHNSQHSSIAHFGLGDASQVDSLVVKWLGNLYPNQVYTNVGVNKMIEIVEGTQAFTVIHGLVNTLQQFETIEDIVVYPNPSDGDLNISYKMTQSSYLEIDILNVEGKVVKHLFNDFQIEGEYILNQQLDLLSGIYIVRLVMNEGVIHRKIIVQN